MTTLPSPKPHRIRPPGTPSANRPLPRNLPPTPPAPTPHPPPPPNGLPTYQSPPSANPPSLPRLPKVSGSILPPPPRPCQATPLPLRSPYVPLLDPGRQSHDPPAKPQGLRTPPRPSHGLGSGEPHGVNDGQLPAMPGRPSGRPAPEAWGASSSLHHALRYPLRR
jgi:hypothetical protein